MPVIAVSVLLPGKSIVSSALLWYIAYHLYITFKLLSDQQYTFLQLLHSQ